MPAVRLKLISCKYLLATPMGMMSDGVNKSMKPSHRSDVPYRFYICRLPATINYEWSMERAPVGSLLSLVGMCTCDL